VRNVPRGLHYQILQPQGKLIQVMAGGIFDVAVDLRRSSPSFGKWIGVTLAGGSHRIAPEHERTILRNDPTLGIRWPLESEPIVSDKDRRGVAFASAELFE
jgi:dTDP-4-dehydrorhamnose 3,5-epimerase